MRGRASRFLLENSGVTRHATQGECGIRSCSRGRTKQNFRLLYALRFRSFPRNHSSRGTKAHPALSGRERERIGLAIANDTQGTGLGSVLLAKALHKAYENASLVGSSMVVVDAIDEGAVRFYEAHGFIKLHESIRLILPMRTIAEL